MLNGYLYTLGQVFHYQVTAVKGSRVELQLIIGSDPVIIVAVFKGKRDNTEINQVGQMNPGKDLAIPATTPR